MRAHRSFRRALAAILQVAALLALTIAAPAHARAHGVAEPVHAHVHAAHADAPAETADASAPGGEGHSGPCCGLHCPFHIPFVGVADLTVALRWNAQAAFRRPRDADFASVVPEALPEPPRSFA